MARTAALILVLTALVLGAWRTVGPHSPVLPWLVGIGGFGVLGMVGKLPEVATPQAVRMPGPKTLTLARALGVPAILRLLDASGWNRLLGRGRHTVYGRAGLRAVREQAASSLTSHWCGAMFHEAVGALLARVS